MSARKPPDRRAPRSKTQDLGPVVARADRPVPPAPHPPGKKLLASTVGAWEAYWRSDVAAIVTDADLPALTRWAELLDFRTRLFRLVRAEPIVEGSQGQPRPNPLLAELARLDLELGRLESSFGMSPASRLKLGLTVGRIARTLESINADFDTVEPSVSVVDAEVLEFDRDPRAGGA